MFLFVIMNPSITLKGPSELDTNESYTIDAFIYLYKDSLMNSFIKILTQNVPLAS